MGDRNRAFLLAEQMLKEEMHDGQRRILILTQVKTKLNEGDLPAAGKVYRKVKIWSVLIWTGRDLDAIWTIWTIEKSPGKPRAVPGRISPRRDPLVHE